MSPDGKRVLLFTNSRKVWRQNTRGDYWALDLTTWQAPEARRPEGRAVDADVRQVLARRRTRRLRARAQPLRRAAGRRRDHAAHDATARARSSTAPSTGSTRKSSICATGSAGAPTAAASRSGSSTLRACSDFDLINDTDSLYSFVVPVQYPKAGTTNSAARVGVVSADGGAPVWLDVPGDPRNNYIARLEWAAGSTEVVLEHLNRAQNTIEVMLGDATSGQDPRGAHRARQRLGGRGRRPALDRRREELHLDQRARRLAAPLRDLARRHQDAGSSRPARSTSKSGQRVRRVVRRGRGLRRRIRLLHRVARQPDAALPLPHQARRQGQAGAGHARRTSRATTTTTISPGRALGVPHLVARSTRRRVVELDPAARATRSCARSRTTAGCKARGRPRSGAARSSSSKVDVGGGLALDGWMMKPPGFDSTKRYPVLFHVYGEPAAQTVHRPVGRRRSTSGTSCSRSRATWWRAWTTAARRRRGGARGGRRSTRRSACVNSADQAAAVRDDARSGATWTRRGSACGAGAAAGRTTLNLMFRYPELYQTGMSVAPVPDQRLYDTIYQERYMGLPQENDAGVPRRLADLLRRRAARQPAGRARLGRRQRALSGHRAAGQRAGRRRTGRSP